MLKVDYSEFEGKAGKYCAAAEDGEVVLIAAPKINLIMLAENEYAEMAKARRNVEYLAEIDKRHVEMLNNLSRINELLEVDDG